MYLMISKNVLLFLCCLLFLFSFNTRNINAAMLLGYYCNNTQNPNSSNTGTTFKSDLNSTLSALPKIASLETMNGFYSFLVGGQSTGFFLCRGDVNTDVCAQCVANASSELLQRCPDPKLAIIWYDMCLLRYTDQFMFGEADMNREFTMWNTQNATDPEKFNQVLGDLVNKIASLAAIDNSGKKFATQEAAYSVFQRRIYALGQCTPDLTSNDCKSCLRNAISYLPGCCYNHVGGRVLFPNCYIRYEIYRFYNTTLPPEPLPSSDQYPPPPQRPGKGKNRLSAQATIGIVISTIISLVLFVVTFFFLKRRSTKRYDAQMQEAIVGAGSLNIDPESLKYSLNIIQIATNNFSVDNKIGKGGFGAVYKGTLPNGQHIAVKRLSKNSGQGVEEFKNEILVVAKLRHNNLVRLLGFCLDGVEKTLIYEFVPNKSLDCFLFDSKKQQLLDWSRRYKIIEGIARGLLYLHQDSPLRVVHRDLKAANILLDESMNAKIADFGMAKICGVDQSEGNTNRIAGTFGYMAPEYTRTGQFSIKSDIFSFGIVILEIITGKKNSSFYKSEDSQDLLSYAWQHWRGGTPLALLDPTIMNSYVKTEVLRCIHVGLLCVEEDADRRPTMASVVYMLNSNSISLPTPYLPAISRHNKSESIPEEIESKRSDTKLLSASVNKPPNPNLPVPNPRLVPKTKPWEVGQFQSSYGAGFQYQESSNGFTPGPKLYN
ncbi:hypothetical protein ACH5RR_014895 [Cinchona calisaya]|uniref:Cysteine-rich receptor-like protein kinase 10 n=1 Tax=Cinchona calisaya TaxID=153742 RepID=A0ABD2ZRK8_9GENT